MLPFPIFQFEFLSTSKLQELRQLGLAEEQIEKYNELEKTKILDRVRNYTYCMERPVDTLKEMNVVILGKTGVGKSTLGCSLLGEEFFRTSAKVTAETKTIQYKYNVVERTKVRIIDTPGFMDTEDDVTAEVAKVRNPSFPIWVALQAMIPDLLSITWGINN